jgi:hypothetical protein
VANFKLVPVCGGTEQKERRAAVQRNTRSVSVFHLHEAACFLPIIARECFVTAVRSAHCAYAIVQTALISKTLACHT